MVLSQKQAIDAARTVLEFRIAERERHETVHDYLRGKQPHPFAPHGAPDDVSRLAKMSRVNIMEIVIDTVAQALYVDGYRPQNASENAEAWTIWQANKMDARQSRVHRAALTYGVSYTTVLPGDPVPVIKSYSPRRMTALYGDDEDWPLLAMSAVPNSQREWLYRVYDAEAVYYFKGNVPESPDGIEFIETRQHGLGVTPVVRFLNVQDPDDDNEGEVEPLMKLQDQIDHTTFNLKTAEHYGAFRQRYIIGWMADTPEDALKASAQRLWAFEDPADQVRVGEFEQTDLKGYLDSREASLRHAATISQTPVHELIGQMINLSAEALIAAEAGQRRKIVERQMSFGESWEQVLGLAGRIAGYAVDDMAQVRWRDTESRTLSATVDALGKMAQMLGIPPQELWERIPGVTQADVERWRMTFDASDVLANFTSFLDRQSQPPEFTEDVA